MKSLLILLTFILVSLIGNTQSKTTENETMCDFLSRTLKVDVKSYVVTLVSRDSINLVSLSIYDRQTNKTIHWNEEKIKLEWLTRNPNVPIGSTIRRYVDYDRFIKIFNL